MNFWEIAERNSEQTKLDELNERAKSKKRRKILKVRKQIHTYIYRTASIYDRNTPHSILTVEKRVERIHQIKLINKMLRVINFNLSHQHVYNYYSKCINAILHTHTHKYIFRVHPIED